jgi:hypothetical protein
MHKINRNKRTHFLWGQLALMVIIFWCASAWAKEGIYFKRSSLHSIDAANNVYLVSGQVDYQLSPYLEQALLNGVVLNSNIQVMLINSSVWWWSQTENISRIDYQLKYHALSRHFLLTRSDTNENWNFRSLPTALRKMGSIVNHRLPALPDSIKEGGYTISLSSTLSPATLRLPLKIQSIFSSQYGMSSEVITWPLP